MTSAMKLPGVRGGGGRYVSGYLSMHAVGGIKAIVEDRRRTDKNATVTAVLEDLVNEALRARHPEWYEDGHKHPFELEIEAQLASIEVEKLAQRLAEAQKAADEKAQMRDKAA